MKLSHKILLPVAIAAIWIISAEAYSWVGTSSPLPYKMDNNVTCYVITGYREAAISCIQIK